MEKFTDRVNESTNTKKVFIEPVASSSDFLQFIDDNDFDFDGNEFFDNMDMWEEGTISSRYSKDWCQKVIDGNAGDYWKDKRQYYPAILKLLVDYNLDTIRFACDW